MKECSAVYSNVVCPSLLGCLRGGRPSEGLLGTKADDDNFDDCASIYFKLSWTSYCANKLQNMFANRTENRVILCWVFFHNWNVVKIWIKKINDVTLTVEDTGSKLVRCFCLLLMLTTDFSWELFNWYFLILMFSNKVKSIQWDQEGPF